MALKAAEKMQLDFINETAKMLGELNIEESLIIEKLKEKVSDLENSANCKLVLAVTDGVQQFNVIDLRSDFVRTRFNNAEKTQLSLRAKILGLPIDIKVKKDEDVFSNKEVVKSLRELADIVEQMPVSMLEHGQDDWSRTAGELPKSLAENDGVGSEILSELVQDPEATEEVVASQPVVEAAPVVDQPAPTVAQAVPQPQVNEASPEMTLPGESVAAPSAGVPDSPVKTNDELPSQDGHSLI